MSQRKRVHALMLCAAFMLVLLVSSALSVHEADHDCLAEAVNPGMKVISLLEALGDDVKAEELVEGMEPEDYPEEGTDIEGTGILASYEEDGYEYLHLVDAELKKK